jgi:hypothetical protein
MISEAFIIVHNILHLRGVLKLKQGTSLYIKENNKQFMTYYRCYYLLTSNTTSHICLYRILWFSIWRKLHCIMSSFIICTPRQILLECSNQGEWDGQHARGRRNTYTAFVMNSWRKEPLKRSRDNIYVLFAIIKNILPYIINVLTTSNIVY